MMARSEYHDEEDIEKRAQHAFDESDDEYSTTTSQYSAHSHTRILSSQYRTDEPILAQYASAHREAPNTVRIPLFRQAVCVCTPRKFTRYFTSILVLTIVIFFITLAQLSRSSSRTVGLGLHRAQPPPPPWLKFEFLTRYHGGVRSLVSRKENSPEYPVTIDSSDNAESQAKKESEEDARPLPSSIPMKIPTADDVVTCFLDDAGKISMPDVRVFPGVPKGMPDNVMGSHDLLGLVTENCYDRFGRLGPYGLGYTRSQGGSGAGMDGDREGSNELWEADSHIDFRKVNWTAAQENCLEANIKRYATATARPTTNLQPGHDKREAELQTNNLSPPIARKAVIIRTWNDYEYDDEDLFFLRSLMWELALQTGAEYTLHFLIHVRDDQLPIWGDEDFYRQTLKDSLPAEFEGMGTLWSEGQMQLIYNALPYNEFRDLPLHGVYRSHHMPLAWFSHQHPEFEQMWQIEMDMRYTGHYHELITKVEQWAAKQPRKGIWERNARFYIPSEHGSWEDFSHMVRVQTEHGTSTKSNLFSNLANNPSVPDYVKNQVVPKAEKAIWGPEPPTDDFHDNSTDVVPPHPMAQDKGEWGVDEDADLILFNPLFDPDGTNWLLSDDVTGYNRSSGLPPRRAAVSSFGRYSKRLLKTMHRDMAIHGKHMFTEMFPATTALHHGYKAVYVPHPVYVDRKWPTDLLAATFNGGRNGRAGGSRLSVFSEEREHNFKGLSWYYNSGFGPNLWQRWLGYKVDNDGGEAEEMAGEGRMCLPAMLLHPVKQVNLIYQEDGEEEDGK